MNTIAGFLKGLRVDNNLSISELAELSGISASAISRIERGQREPLFSTVVEIVNSLNAGEIFYEFLKKVFDNCQIV